ncbi:MAG TPA: hypothetical protein G4N96_13535 [Chloroflexi bacterium]|nr:hypothetical protein [Chloroflexota bacterium]
MKAILKRASLEKTDEGRKTKDENLSFVIRPSSFVIRHWLLALRRLSFTIHHSPFTIYHSPLRLILLATIFFGVSSPAQAQEPPPDPRFGIANAYVNAAETTAAGAGYTRIILRWDIIQPAGRDDWKPANVPDPFIEAELAAGREVVVVLIGTPDWASKGVNDSRAVPDMEAWGNFTKRVAQQYQGRIHQWIIWNEPDVWDTANPANTWLGTEEDYLQLLKSAHSNIKTVDPTMQIHLAGLTYHWDADHGREQYLSRLLKLITADPEAPRYGYYFDALGYHVYNDPAQILRAITEARATLDVYRLDKPVWLNETNAPPTNDPLEPVAEPSLQITQQEQAAFVIQAFALSIAGGAQRAEFYELRNAEGDPVPFGLLRHDDSRRPAFDAYRVMTKHLAGYTSYNWLHQGNFYIVTLDRGGQTTTILWNTSPEDRPFSINAIAPQAILVDEAGNEQPISAQNGIYTIVLPGASCANCAIGGAPRLLIEQGSPDQRVSLVPLATNTPTPTAAPTAMPSATLTPSATATPVPAAPTLPPPTADAVAAAAPNVTPPPTVGPAKRPSSASDAPAEIIVPTFNLKTLFTPGRIVILLVLGIVLFTLIYFIQFKLWSKWRR